MNQEWLLLISQSLRFILANGFIPSQYMFSSYKTYYPALF
jgi:hypothetical protein